MQGEVFSWLIGLAKETKENPIVDSEWGFGRKLRYRIKVMVDRYNWHIHQDESTLNSSYEVYLWKRVRYRFKKGVVGFKITNHQGNFRVEFTRRIPSIKEWMRKQGWYSCPECGRFTRSQGICFNCEVRKAPCQICGEPGKYWADHHSLKILRRVSLHGFKPLCSNCRRKAEVEYMAGKERLKKMNPDMWVEEEGGLYKLQITAVTVEGEEEVFLFSLNKEPSKRDIRKAVKIIPEGFVRLNVDVSEVGRYKH